MHTLPFRLFFYRSSNKRIVSTEELFYLLPDHVTRSLSFSVEVQKEKEGEDNEYNYLIAEDIYAAQVGN